MRKIEILLSEYGESHQTPFNKKVHYFCVPAIFFSLIGLLACIPLSGLLNGIMPVWITSYMHIGSLAIVLGLMYYLRLSFVLFMGMLVFSLLALVGINKIASLDLAPLWAIMLVIFAVAWIMQFIGHNHEGKKPSFLKDVQFLMIGPAWTMSHLFKSLKIKF
ncbi:hypothetical protein A8C32_15425 [Flavivirga aquatica]|uniref:DUF962 domain-containing protein n=1 Tax=Flavivirga aquatica TaxID=1849968 RepID=A0A1E5T9L4_9FLAO|nr:Mpo1-like protein [Flavivirga aquatica]OEK08073.1 hypothetical protein A8C32_15425 [Flavivirga aquatica]